MTESHVEPHTRARVGEMLRKCRVRAGLDLAEVAQCLHIRQPFLRAIENGQFEALPAPVYAVGFLRTYADYLGLDAAEVVRQFRHEIAGLGARAPLHFPLPVAEGNTPKGGMLLLGALIAIAAYAGWYATSTRAPEVAEIGSPVPERLAEERATVPSAALPKERAHAELQKPAQDLAAAVAPAAGRSSADSAPPSSKERIDAPPAVAPSSLQPALPAAAVPAPATPPPPAVTTQPAEPPTAGYASGGNPAASVAGAGGSTASTAMAAEPPGGGMPSVDAAGRIMLRAKADSWVEVRDPQTNTLLAARLLKAGDVYRIPDRPGLKLVTGNAGGLVVMVDGEVVPPLGKEGVVRRGVPLDADTLRRGTEGTQ